jgi:hypothetical protein
MVPWRLPIELGRPPCSGAGLRKRQARHIPAGAPGVTTEDWMPHRGCGSHCPEAGPGGLDGLGERDRRCAFQPLTSRRVGHSTGILGLGIHVRASEFDPPARGRSAVAARPGGGKPAKSHQPEPKMR